MRIILGYGLIGLVMFAAQHAVAADLALVTVERQVMKQERVFDAVIEAVHQSTVSSQLVGRVVEINYDAGDFVPKDAVIMRFRDTEQRARFEQSTATLKEAQVRFKEASDELKRIEDVYARKLVAKANLDSAVAEQQAAKARLEAAEAQLAEASEQLDHTLIRAPFSGNVTRRHVEVGETVAVGQALMTGFSYAHLRATTEIPQALVNTVREHNQARVLLHDDAGVVAESIRVFPYADEQSHAFTARVNLPQGEYDVYPGMFTKVAFVTGELERLLIPATAVVKRSELTAVYAVAENGAVSLRQVRVGRRSGDQVEVLAGLVEGETIAIDPIAAGIALKQQR